MSVLFCGWLMKCLIVKCVRQCTYNRYVGPMSFLLETLGQSYMITLASLFFHQLRRLVTKCLSSASIFIWSAAVYVTIKRFPFEHGVESFQVAHLVHCRLYRGCPKRSEKQKKATLLNKALT